MLSTPHVIVGVAIATKIPNPLIAIPLAFCSHFVLEMIPHWNPHLNTEMRTYGHLTKQTKGIIALDTFLGVVSAVLLSAKFGTSQSSQLLLLLAALASITPDLMEVPYFFFHIKNKALTLWLKSQKAIQSDADPLLGLTTQLIVIGVAIWWLVN